LGYIFNEHIHYPDHKIGPLLGGTVSYSAVCLGRLGNKTGIVSNIGVDTPDSLIKPILDANVDVQGLNKREGISNTKDLLIYDENGNKNIQYLTRAPEVLFSDIPKPYFNTKIFYLCPVDYEIPISTVEKIADIRGNPHKFMIAADLGGFGGAHSSSESRNKYRNNVIEVLKKYMEFIDIAKASEEDCYHLFNQNKEKPVEFLKKLINLGAKIVILTIGKDGALIGTGEKIFNILPVEANVVDRTGAGDTFTSAFLSEYLNSQDIEKSGVFSSAAASLLIEKTGGVNVKRFPSREEVLNRMKKYGKK
ncbi:MAG: carbohydrate kinase family protein, partial [Candidatus Humimicrobiaceae bacterium]